MIAYRRTIQVAGEDVALLVTPHLYTYKGFCGLTFDAPDKDAKANKIIEYYADLIYAAALNAWEIDGGRELASMPVKRGDIHAWAYANSKELAECISFLVEALTGRSLSDLAKEPKSNKERADEIEDKVKKKVLRMIGL